MKMKLKKFTAAVTAAALFLLTAPVVYGVDGETFVQDGVTYTRVVFGDQDYYSVTAISPDVTDFVVPETVNGVSVGNIRSYAAAGNEYGKNTTLKSVTIPKGISVGSYAFTACTALTSVTLPTDTLDGIYSYTFCSCTSLRSITIPQGINKISISAFKNSGLTSVTLPNGVTKIEATAFANCQNLTSVTIPSSVTLIHESAFYGSENITDIYYGGTESQWKKLLSDSNWDGKIERDVNGEAYWDAVALANDPVIPTVHFNVEIPDIEPEVSTPITSAAVLAAPTAASSSEAGDSVTLKWNAVNGATEYVLKYSADGGNTWFTVVVSANSYALKGLTPNCTYTYKIAAKNGETEGSYTNDYTFTTAALSAVSVNLTAPAAAAYSNISADSVTLKWDAVNGASEYVVKYSADGGSTWFTVIVSANSCTLNGLTPNCAYTYKIAAKNGETEGAYTQEQTFNTTDNLPDTTASAGKDAIGKGTSDKATPDTGVEGVSAVIAAAAVATAVAIVLKRRK